MNLEHINGIIYIVIDEFVLFEPISASFLDILNLGWVVKSKKYLKSEWFALFLLAVHLYYILVKLEHINGIICIIIVDFVFLTPLQLHFCPFWYVGWIIKSTFWVIVK